MTAGSGYSLDISIEQHHKVFLIANELVVSGRHLKFGLKVKDNADFQNATTFVVGCFDHGQSVGFKLEYNLLQTDFFR